MPPHYHPHGFSRPFSRPQVASWFLTVSLPALFYGLVLPVLPYSSLFLSVFTVSVSAALLCGGLCTATDPTDVGVQFAQSPSRELTQCQIAALVCFCQQCQARVSPCSQHCTLCNRCTYGFDHHCVWVNNCVGQDNYRWFAGTIAALEVAIVTEGCAAACVLTSVLQDGITSSDTVSRFDFGDSGIAYFCALLTTAVVCAVIAVSNGCVLAFHLLVRCHAFLRHEAPRKVSPLRYAPQGGALVSLQNELSRGVGDTSDVHWNGDVTRDESRKDRVVKE